METAIVYWGLYGDNGKENGNHYTKGFGLGIFIRILGLKTVGSYLHSMGLTVWGYAV